MSKSPYQQQLETLPEWVQSIVEGLRDSAVAGFSQCDMPYERAEKFVRVFVDCRHERLSQLFEGLQGALALAHALSAPWPPPAAPVRERRALNVVEMVADNDD